MRHVYRRHCSKVVTATGQERVLSTVEVEGSDGERTGGKGAPRGLLSPRISIYPVAVPACTFLSLSLSLPSVLRIGDLISLDNAELRNGENISTGKNGPLKKEWTRGNVVGPASYLYPCLCARARARVCVFVRTSSRLFSSRAIA